MVLDLILPVLAGCVTNPFKKYVVTPVTRHVGYVFKCTSKVQTLQDGVDQLKNKKVRLQNSVDAAIRNVEEIYPNVTTWLSSADKAIEDGHELVQHKDEEVKKRCFVGLCPNFMSRYRLSKKAVNKASVIDKLQNEEGLDLISFPPLLQQIVGPSAYRREALPSRVLMLNQIMDALRDPNLNMIGVYGMGGVGKTTLAKEVQGKAVEEKLFEAVIFVAVSQTPELRRIQSEIGDFLGLKFFAEELSGRASQLYKRLEKSKVLIILDDLWHKLDFVAVGIPCGDASKDFKIMLTSRSKDLLSCEMRAQKLFSLEALKDDETLSLFEMSVVEAKDPKFHSIATKIAKKCAGLPLLIQLVATELQNKGSYVWEDKLNQLSALGDGEVYQRVHKVLQSSYDNLPGDEMKSFFLLCAVFGQSNIQIQYLLTHSMGLGLFKHTRNIEGARAKVLTLIDGLKAKSLLLDGDMVGFIKMHDVVRDTALSITSRVQHAFIRSSEARLNDWPTKDCTRISFPCSDVCELPGGLDCPEAELILLFAEDICLEIPDLFFEKMNKLKVADFMGMHLLSLPSSIGLLTNLQTLCLHRCQLNNVAMVGELKQLESLSFANSKIGELPREIEALTRLKLLDLRNCSDLKVIPENVFSKLCSLEELYMLNSFVQWNAIGQASLVELDNLSHLLTLEIQIVNSKMIPQSCMFFHGLRSYKISIGDEWGYWEEKNERSRSLKLKLDAGIHLKDGIKLLFKGAEDLYLSRGWGIESVLYDLDQEGFPQMKHLHVRNDFGIQHLIKSTRWGSCVGFPILESLHLDSLFSLEKICDAQLEMGSFGELRSIKIHGCDKLKSLFSSLSTKCLPHLREMEVESCKNMKAVVEDENYNNEVIEFLQLSSLKLKNLPNLTSFCKREVGTAPKELLFHGMVSFPKLTSLEVSNCQSLKYVFAASMVECLLQLKQLEILDCELVEELIESKKEEEIEQENIKVIVFSNLVYLQLINLPNVKTFSRGYSIKFPLLRELTLIRCRAMKNFVSNFSSNGSDEGYFFNQMVTFSNLEYLYLYETNFKHLWDVQSIRADDDSFSKLKSLSICMCSKLSVVFPPHVFRRFQRLEALDVSYCYGVEEIYQYEGIDFKEINYVESFSLRTLCIQYLPSLKNVWSHDPCGVFTFENLQSVDVRSCDDLKYVIPASIACGLLQLQQLKIRQCKNVFAIIAKEKDNKSDPSFQFMELTALELENLNEMRSLYEGPHTFECPKLKSLQVRRLYMKDLILSNIFIDKICGNVEELGIDEHAFNSIQQKITEFSVFKLKKLTLHNFKEESSSIAVLFGFLRRLKCLEMLVFRVWHLEETFFGLDNQRQLHHLISLKHLEFYNVRGLKHIVTRKTDSTLIHILHHLHALKVEFCNGLMNIAASSSSASFQNLTTLHVAGCGEMTNLVTASTAKTMVQLIELKVESCKMIEEIVIKDDGDDNEHDRVITFNKLKRLELDHLTKFKSFCSNSFTFKFPLLEQVTVSGCPGMKTFCGGDLSTPKLRSIRLQYEQRWEGNLNDTIASQLREWVGEHVEEGTLFQNVESLQVVNDAFCSKAILANQMHFLNKLRKITVRDCDLVQVVFDLEGLSAEDGHAWLLPQLEELNLVNLPVLTHLCNKAPKGILDFGKLKVLEIQKCSRLEYVFTWSMASCLFHLQMLHLTNCEMIESIIKEEEADEDALPVTLGSLESIDLKCLPKFMRIYSGTGDLECPSLKKISIRECPTIKSFVSKLTREDRQGMEEHNLIRFSHKVFPEMEELSLDIKFITAILQIELPTNFFSNVKNINLGCFSATTKSYVLLLHFLSKLPNPVQLEVSNSSIKELFRFEGLSSNMEEAASQMPKIRALNLENLDSLKHIWGQNSQLHASLFRNLTSLFVYGCNQLSNVMTSSVAKSMVQLETFRVKSCKMLMEIVGDRNDITTQEIVFTKMKTLELVDLQSLGSFSLGCCTLEFPCLEQVVVSYCSNMRVFCPGNISTPMLNSVKDGQYSSSHSYWEENLNSTIEHLHTKNDGFRFIKDVKLSIFPTLKENWGDQFQFVSFFWLERLVVDDCPIITNAISSRLLQQLNKLKVLIVEKCELLEQVFDLEGLNATDGRTKKMKYLSEMHLIDLPKLTRAWGKDPQRILSFKNLQLLKVHNCANLNYVFDFSMALNLPNLQLLEVKNCSLVEHIIAKGEENMREYQTVFPSLQSLTLHHLTSLMSFYSASAFLECPSLKIIEVAECPNMELVASAFSSQQNMSMIIEETDKLISNEILFLGKKIAIPGLEELKAEWNSLKGILYGDNPPDFLRRLKHIELTGFEDDEYAIFPFNFLQRFPKLEKLALSDASVEEVNLQELSILKGEGAESLVLLTKLKISNLPKLKYLVHDDSQPVPLFQILEDLQVVECSSLEILVSSTVSFQNLTNLEVSKCDGLINLMTASTARSLVQLKRMNVKDCDMMQEIVGIASHKVEYEIRFSQLEYLGLNDLPCLTSFCSGNCGFNFPSLKEVMVIGCPNMKGFTEQVPTAPKLWRVKTGLHEYDWEWEGSLNNTIQALFLFKDVEETDT